ncbi:MAG: TonB-dependent receptor plug domain-containing protein, partial [Arenimonas sp.]|nr:TonB-dependent receptor plug domain-containing protein [Arenimonas sp.]
MKTAKTTNIAAQRSTLYVSLLLAFAGAASAQEAATEPETEVDQARVLDRVKVTAQGREQELRDVPIAVTVVDGEMIDNLQATNLGDLDGFVPGLEITSSSITQPRYSIRGISTGDFGVGTDPAVGIYIDGVYAARSGGAMLAFNDVERIEVLKGPQGTLFGRNTAAGAISIVTKRPTMQQEGNASLRIGNDGLINVYGLYNLPVTDSSAVRISYTANDSDGWLTDSATGEDLNPERNWASKIAWRTKFGTGTVLDISWDHEEVNQLARPVIGIVPLNPYPYPANFPADPDTYLDPFEAPVYNDVVGNRESRVFNGVTLQLYHGFEWASMTYSAAYRGFDTVNREDEDGTNRINLYLDTANVEDNSSFYQELKFNGVAGSVDWIAGASWYR